MLTAELLGSDNRLFQRVWVDRTIGACTTTVAFRIDLGWIWNTVTFQLMQRTGGIVDATEYTFQAFGGLTKAQGIVSRVNDLTNTQFQQWIADVDQKQPRSFRRFEALLPR